MRLSPGRSKIETVDRSMQMAKVTGLGGVFYRVADTAATQKWYQETLGVGGK